MTKTLEDYWNDYRDTVLTPHDKGGELRTLKGIFYSGAVAATRVLADAAKKEISEKFDSSDELNCFGDLAARVRLFFAHLRSAERGENGENH
jgi:hypothetical protein